MTGTTFDDRVPPQVSFSQTSFAPRSFFGRLRTLFAEKVVKTQLERLKESGAYDCFNLKWHPCYDVKRSFNGCSAPGGSPPSFIWASDIGKWIEAACYFLADPTTATSSHAQEFRAAIDKMIGEMTTAQEPDGYLNAYFQVVDKEGKLKNLRDLCEGYSCGHLIEAALAHYHLTGSREFLDIMIKNLDCFIANFGPGLGQRPGYPGHPELELASLRLYRVTNDPHHLQFARYLLEERGQRRDTLDNLVYLDWEADQRGDNRYPTWISDLGDHSYSQSHKPVHQQEDIVGHSVQAFYLLTAAADLGDDYLTDAHRLFADAIDRKMYVSGGFGSDPAIEGFHDQPYYLPQSTHDGGCYAETCASISAMMVAERLLSYELNAGYRDALERCLYNNVIGGTSLDAESFYYWNKLETCGQENNLRSYWYEGMLGGYIWSAKSSRDEVVLTVHVYAAASRTICVGEGQVEVAMTTEMPWKGGVRFVASSSDGLSLRIRLPVPKWAKNFKCSVPATPIAPGYIEVQATSFALDFELPVLLEQPNPRTNRDTLTVCRGPIVYCLEDTDNAELEAEHPHFAGVGLSPQATFQQQAVDVGNVPLVLLSTLDVFTPAKQETLYSYASSWTPVTKDVTFIPFFARANRGGRGRHKTSLLRVA